MPEVARPTTGSSLLSASEAEANDVSLHAESATAPGAGLLSGPYTRRWGKSPDPGVTCSGKRKRL